MTKTQLIDAIAIDAGISKIQAKKSLEAFIKVTSASLKQGEKVQLVGFGSFSVVEKPARAGRNPRTGEAIEIAAHRVVKFKAGSELGE